MIVTCSNCFTSLQVDESKANSERFAVRCPKCQNTIPVQLKAANSNAAAAVSSPPPTAAPPTAGHPPPAPSRSWEAPSAATYQKKTAKNVASSDPVNSPELLQLLADALKPKETNPTHNNYSRELKRVLVCLNPERREATARLLDDSGYTVFLADNPAQATEKIRDEEVDIVVLSSDFAVKFGGASVVQQMINMLLPRERRKIFVVLIDENLQTFSTHEAFLRNTNLIVNGSDLHHLPSILHRALRDFDELYRYFKQALDTVHV